MRFFVSLEPDSASKDYLAGVVRNLKDILGSANYTYRNNLHLTLAFCSEVSERKIDLLHQALFKELFSESVVLENNHFVSCFEKGEKQLFFLKLFDSQNRFCHLCSLVREAMDSLDISYDEKPFMPHITLARNVSIDLASQTAKSLKFDDFTFRFSKISFIKSERTFSGMRYSSLHEIELKGKEEGQVEKEWER